MKIAHESPLALLEESKLFNDYDYAVAPLLNGDTSYYEFFVESLKKGREVIIDNGIEDPLELADYVTAIRKLIKDSKLTDDKKLTYVFPFIPDGCDETTKGIKEFLKRFKKIPCRSMAIIQGTSFLDLFKSFHDIYPFADKIGIPINSKAYEDFFETMQPQISLLEKQTHGRQLLIEQMYHAGWLVKDKPLHLIDIGLPNEYGYYIHKHAELSEFIETANTIDPIVQGVNGVEYDNPITLREKQPELRIDTLERIASETPVQMALQNIRVFRVINNLPPRSLRTGAVLPATNALSSILIPANAPSRR